MKCNQTVIQCCRCAACGRDGLASGARARVRQGVAVSEVQPRQKPHKDSQSGWMDRGLSHVQFVVCRLPPSFVFLLLPLAFD